MSIDEQETFDQVFAILDANIVRQAYQVADLVLPDRKFGSRKSAGVAAQKHLAKLAHQGLAVTAYRGWRKVGCLKSMIQKRNDGATREAAGDPDMSAADEITPFDAVDPADWDTPTPHVRVYRLDQRWRVAVNMATGDTSVFSGSMLFQRVFLTRGPSGGLVPVSDMNSSKVDMLSYAVAVLYDDAGMLDQDMEELGLSLSN